MFVIVVAAVVVAVVIGVADRFCPCCFVAATAAEFVSVVDAVPWSWWQVLPFAVAVVDFVVVVFVVSGSDVGVVAIVAFVVFVYSNCSSNSRLPQLAVR